MQKQDARGREGARREGERQGAPRACWPDDTRVPVIASTCPDLTVTLCGPREESRRAGAVARGVSPGWQLPGARESSGDGSGDGAGTYVKEINSNASPRDWAPPLEMPSFVLRFLKYLKQ